MICTKCGKELERGYPVCLNCGQRWEVQEGEEEEKREIKQYNKNKNKINIVVLVIAVVLVLALFMFPMVMTFMGLRQMAETYESLQSISGGM